MKYTNVWSEERGTLYGANIYDFLTKTLSLSQQKIKQMELRVSDKAP